MNYIFGVNLLEPPQNLPEDQQGILKGKSPLW
jgi:hypothetical protein